MSRKDKQSVVERIRRFNAGRDQDRLEENYSSWLSNADAGPSGIGRSPVKPSIEALSRRQVRQARQQNGGLQVELRPPRRSGLPASDEAERHEDCSAHRV